MTPAWDAVNTLPHQIRQTGFGSRLKDRVNPEPVRRRSGDMGIGSGSTSGERRKKARK